MDITMNIAVCVKQVPAGQGTVMDPEKGVLIRLAADSMLNPYDPYAIEAALQIAEALGGSVTVVTMGPPSAEKTLREAMAMGVSGGIHLCGPAFAGADVYATAYTLAQGIRKAGGFDLICCGQQTTDGDTAQLPFSLGVQLGIPVIGWVTRLVEQDARQITVEQEVTGGTQTVSVPFPAILAIGRDAVQPRLPSLRSRLQAQKKELTRWDIGDMPEQNPERYGLKGSPTRVRKLYAPEMVRKAVPITEPPEAAARRILEAVALLRKGGG